MSLVTYRRKRDFRRTPEPRGRAKRGHARGLLYLIQKHAASRLHYDFRLELEGVLRSWAVPKGPSLDPSRKALAVQVEDHPLEYGDFEGVIPEGQYGGGTVLLWDKGTWEPLHDPREGLERGKLHFVLHGEKLKGEWSLVRMGGGAGDGGKNWLLMKLRDAYGGHNGTHDILQESPESVKSGRTLEEIRDEPHDIWDSQKGRQKVRRRSPALKMSKGAYTSMPAHLSPQLAVLAEHPPAGEEWLHEIKFDGYRLLAFMADGAITLRTRTGEDWTRKFAPIARSLAKLAATSAIVDGEVMILDDKGISNFQSLQRYFKTGAGSLVYYAFDLPYCDGNDLRKKPLLERKEMLGKLLKGSKLPANIRYSDHVRGQGGKVIEKACAAGAEGIVSKQADAPYVERRERSWIKSKCLHQQEFVIVGYTESDKQGRELRSLLLGYYDEKGKLVYCGRVGTGFDEILLRDLRQRLEKIRQREIPLDTPPPVRERRAGQWVKPELVCEVRFSGWTSDGVLRHPVFIALREDKPPREVVREKEAPMTNGKVKVSKNGLKARPQNGRHIAASTNGTAKSGEESVAGVRLTHPDKVLFPQVGRGEKGLTKRDVAAYYESIQEFLLPHVLERPLSLRRCPEGVDATCFIMRNWNTTLPKAVDKVDIGGSKHETHVMIHDFAGVISLVQISALEIHTWNCAAKDIEHADQLVFDLDPGPDVPWKVVTDAARQMHALLNDLKLPAFLKTSGGKGLHLTVPIVANIGWDEVKEFCRTMVTHMASESDLFVINMRKDLRGGKVYLDYLRNGRGATAIAPYSTRARPAAGISMPIAWDELADVKSGEQFTLAKAGRYLAKRHKDPWGGFEKARVDLAKAVESVKR